MRSLKVRASILPVFLLIVVVGIGMTPNDPGESAESNVLGKGRQALAAGDLQAAIEYYTAALSASPAEEDRWLIYFERAIAYGFQGKEALLVQDLAAALDRTPPPDYACKIHVLLAVAHLRQCRPEAAWEEIGSAAKLMETNPEVLAARATIRLRWRGEYKEAFQDFDGAVAAARSIEGSLGKRMLSNALRQRGEARLRLGQTEMAWADFNEDLQLAPGATTYRNLMVVRLVEGNPRAARLVWSRASSRVQLTPSIEAVLGLVALCEGNQAGAKEWFAHANARGLSAILDYSEGKTVEALAALSELQSQSVCPSGMILVDPLPSTIPQVSGILQWIDSRTEEARLSLWTAMNHSKIPGLEMAFLAMACGGMKKEMQVKKDINAILTQYPVDLWGVRLVRFGLGEITLDQLLKELADQPSLNGPYREAEAYYVAGEVALRKGLMELAAQHFERSVRHRSNCGLAPILADIRLKLMKIHDR
jgi:tetratricopeptide (TPR) repeat protein